MNATSRWACKVTMLKCVKKEPFTQSQVRERRKHPSQAAKHIGEGSTLHTHLSACSITWEKGAHFTSDYSPSEHGGWSLPPGRGLGGWHLLQILLLWGDVLLKIGVVVSEGCRHWLNLLQVTRFKENISPMDSLGIITFIYQYNRKWPSHQPGLSLTVVD